MFGRLRCDEGLNVCLSFCPWALRKYPSGCAHNTLPPILSGGTGLHSCPKNHTLLGAVLEGVLGVSTLNVRFF